MDRQKVEFESLEYKQTHFSAGREKVLYTLRGYTAQGRGRKSRKQRSDAVEAGSMLWKLGLCAGVCALMLLMNNHALDPNDTTQTQDEERPTQTPVEEMGKLRFVELPGLISVFSQKEQRAFPIACSGYTLLEDDTLLSIVPNSVQDVAAMEDCTVKAVGNDESKGKYVTLRAAKDREWTLYGMQEIRVEKGQSLYAKDTLGTVQKGETVYITLRVNGRPQDMRAVFDLDGTL